MEERRKSKSDRFATNLKAKYFLKESSRNEICTIVDISRNGAGLEFHTSKEIEIGSNLLLEIFIPNKIELTVAEGIVRWGEQRKEGFLVGIEATSRLDEDKFAKVFKCALEL